MPRYAFLYPLSAILLWSGNVIVSKLSASAIAPGAITFYRLLLAVGLLSLFVLKGTWANRREVLRQLPRLFLLGCLAMAVYQCLSYWAAETSSATNMAVLTALAPLLTLLLSVALLRERPTLGMLFGGALSLLGVAWLVGRGQPLQLWAGGVHLGDGLMLLASLLYALYSVLLRKWAIPLPAWQSTYVQALSALAVMACVFAGLPTGSARLNATTMPLILYAGVLASVLLPFLWIQGVAAIGPSRCSIFMNLLPLLTALLAVLMLGERLHGYHLAGGGAALAGVVLAQVWRRPLGRSGRLARG